MSPERIEESPVRMPRRLDVPTEFRAWIAHTLRTRHAPADTLAGRLEGKVKTAAAQAWHVMRKRPVAGSALVGAVGLAAAMTIGVGELAAAAIFGYAAYQVLREGVPPKEAAQRAFQELGKI